MTNSTETLPTGPPQDGYYDLGTYGRKITTTSEDAQLWFNRGLVWVYSFNHEEAAQCFEKAAHADPSCAIARWGLAYALGPNYNKPWELFDQADLQTTVEKTYRATKAALSLAPTASAIELALIHSIQVRYQSEHNVSKEEYARRNTLYADQMQAVYEDHPDDLDVAVLYADSLMSLTPWKLWDLATGAPTAGARTLEAKHVLERALAQDGGDHHPGLLHMYIHLVEMSPRPELGIRAADQLRELVPDAGHMLHMPTHLDVLVGDYRQSIRSNHKASLADEKFAQQSGALNFYTMYRLHVYHSLIYAAMFAGQLGTALEAVGRMEKSVPEELLRIESPPMAEWMEVFAAVRPHVLIRFGLWEEILGMALPGDKSLYCVTTATLHYAKGVAWAATGRVVEAEKERDRFREALERVPPTRMDYPNHCSAILAVGAAMLDGEIQYRAGRFAEAFRSLRRAVELDNALVYSEPWGWMQPACHALAALLLEQGHVGEAAEIYATDLGLNGKIGGRRHPNNVWSLQGYYECLTRLGRKVEALMIKPQLDLALAVADVPIKASCFCRTTEGSSRFGCCSTST